MDELNAVDRRILAILQEDASLPVAEIAARVNLSATPVWRRIQKLQAAGIIERQVALLDPAKVGFDITVFVEVHTDDHSAAWLEQFAAVVAEFPEVMEVYRMAGDIDYLLRVSVPTMAAFDAFYRQLIGRLPLRNVTSRFAMERVKHTTAYPLQD
jgi:Lrp/AsnC family transcriptional regulator